MDSDLAPPAENGHLPSDAEANHRDAVEGLRALSDGETKTVRQVLERIADRSAGSIKEAGGDG